MEANFEVVLRKESYNKEDLKALASELNEHESLHRLKRRWLMDLPLSMSEQKRIEEILPPSDKMMPESLLREDDVSYEDIKTCIERGFGAHDQKEILFVQKDVQVVNSRNLLRDAFALLDDMNNSSLCSFIKILTGGIIKFEKTNSSMKRRIRRLLRNAIADKNGISEKKLKQVFQLLKDPKFFCTNQIVCSTASEDYRAAAVKVLDGLGDFPSRTLIAMLRKLRGVKGYIPSMQPSKYRKGRDTLIKLVKKHSMEMLSDLGEEDEPVEQLAGALGVAGLTLKLIMNHSTVRNFRKFSPEIEALQNDIAKAIHLLDDTRRESFIELKKVQHLLDPDSRLSARSLRTAVRNLLTDYLFECSDMDKFPDCILQTLDIINRRSQLPSGKKSLTSKVQSSPQELMKEVIQKEVECVVNVSAQAKEVVLNSLPGHEFDEDFARAYLEDFGGSDSLSDSDDDGVYERVTECVGETDPGDFHSPVSTSERDDCSPPDGMMDASLESINATVSQLSGSGNQYLELQEACDVTSMVAYRCIGHVLDKFAKAEGLELDRGDRLYLKSYSSVAEDSEESPQAFSTSELSEIWKSVLHQ